jgi:hypothetical protein
VTALDLTDFVECNQSLKRKVEIVESVGRFLDVCNLETSSRERRKNVLNGKKQKPL